MTAPKAPASLQSRGRKTWNMLQQMVEFTDAETLILLEICRCLDMIDALSGAIKADGVMVEGSQGQSVLNPAIAELRQQQASLARLLPALHLPEELEAATQKRTTRAKAGAAGKWLPPGLQAVN